MGEALTLAILMTLKDEVSGSLGGIKEKLGGVGMAAVAIGGAAVAGVGAFGKVLWDAAEAAGEEEVGIAKLAASVKASGGDWDTASVAIEGYLSQQLARTALDDGAGREAISTLTNMTGDYSKALDLMGLAQDLARAKSIDLNTAAEIVGKVAAGNTGILMRYGIVLEEGATSVEALGQMQETFGGQAEAYGSTFAGAQDKMDIALGNLKETVGAAVIPILTELFSTLAVLATQAMPYLESAINAVYPVIQNVFGWVRDNVVPILSAVISFVVTNWPAVSKTIGAVLSEVWRVVSSVLTAVRGAWDGNLGGIRTIVTTVFNLIKGTIQNVMEVIRGIIKVFTSAIKGDWEGVWTGVKQIFTGIWNQIKLQLNTSLTLIKTGLSTAWAAIRTVAASAWEGIVNVIKGPVNAIIRMVNTVLGAWNALEIRIPGFGFDLPSVTILGQTIGGGHLGWAGATIGTPDVPLIPTLGEGGIVTRPTLAMIGERGPEAVIPLSGMGGMSSSELLMATRALIQSVDALVNALGGHSAAETMLQQMELRARLSG